MIIIIPWFMVHNHHAICINCDINLALHMYFDTCVAWLGAIWPMKPITVLVWGFLMLQTSRKESWKKLDTLMLLLIVIVQLSAVLGPVTLSLQVELSCWTVLKGDSLFSSTLDEYRLWVYWCVIGLAKRCLDVAATSVTISRVVSSCFLHLCPMCGLTKFWMHKVHLTTNDWPKNTLVCQVRPPRLWLPSQPV